MPSNNVSALSLPVLYSFRRCPYAIRARLALLIARLNVELREVKLSDKPKAMLELSPKGTVPVLQLANGTVLDESNDIISWAHSLMADSANWLWAPNHELLSMNDEEFKFYLDRYKYFERYPDQPQQAYRQQCFPFLMQLEARLSKHGQLLSNEASFIDIAIVPFVRQFAKVDEQWFNQSQFSAVAAWLAAWLQHPLFQKAMSKFSPWSEGQPPVFLV